MGKRGLNMNKNKLDQKHAKLIRYSDMSNSPVLHCAIVMVKG